MEATSHRDSAFDVIRVIALFLVVLVHTHQGELLISQPLDALLFFLGKLGVPLFVMISGALLLPKEESIHFFYQKRLNKIVLPWVFWSLIYLLFKLLTGSIQSSTITDLFRNFCIIFLSDFWFMPMITGIYIVTPYLRVVTRSRLPLWYGLLAWLFLVSVLPYFYLSPLFPGTASAGLMTVCLSFCGYFILGWYVRKYWIKTAQVHTFVIMLIVSFSLYAFGLFFFRNQPNQLFFATQDYLSPTLVVAAIALFALLYQKSSFIEQAISKPLLYQVSNSSYGMFLSHVIVALVLAYLLPNIFAVENSIGWLLRAILVYSVSATVVTTLARLPQLHRYIT